MTLDHKGGPSRNRRPTHKREVYFKVVNGKEVVAAMPRSRGAKTKAKTKEQNEWFRQANWATKYWAPHLIQQYREWVHGTPLMPRDLMIMVMANRFAMITLNDGRRLYPMTALSDVSQSLDVIGQTPGDIIVRGTNFWSSIPVGLDNQILAVDPTSHLPTWVNPPAQPSIQLIERRVLTANAADVVFNDIPATFFDLMLTGQCRSTQAVSFANLSVRLNHDGAANYSYTYVNRYGNVTSNSASQMLLGSITANSSPAGDAGIIQIGIPNYAGSTFNKQCSAVGTPVGGAGVNEAIPNYGSGEYKSTAPVTDVTLFPSVGLFLAGTVFSLYGIS